MLDHHGRSTRIRAFAREYRTHIGFLLV